MPTYQFYCDPDDDGCSEVTEFCCLYADKQKNQPKSCPKCRKRKALRELFGGEVVHIPSTLGSLAEKNAGKMSADEKNHLNTRHTAYKTQGNWVETADGLRHKSQL